MEQISIIDVQIALKVLFHEVQSTEGADAYELLQKYVEQEKAKKLKEQFDYLE